MLATLALEMERTHKTINADHQDIGSMVASGTSDDELTRNGIVTTEQGEPLNICQWMWLNPE